MAKVHVGCSRSERPGQTQGRGHHPVHYYSPDASRRASGDMARYQTWSIETGVHEAGVRALLTIMSAAMPNTKQFIACAPDGSIFNVPFDLAIELDCAAEEECLRIACWEHGGLAVIASMEVFRIVCVCVCVLCVSSCLHQQHDFHVIVLCLLPTPNPNLRIRGKRTPFLENHRIQLSYTS